MSNSSEESQTHCVGVALWHPDGAQVLLRDGGLPTLSVPEAADLPGIIQATWKADAWLLHDGGRTFGMEGVAQLQARTPRAPAGLTWGVLEVPPPLGAREWQRPGWPERARTRLDAALRAHGLIRQGEPTLVSAYDLGTVIRADTEQGPVFLKVGDGPREAAVTEYLSAHHPQGVPPVLGTDASTGTLVTLSGGELLDGWSDLSAWTGALERLAYFQTHADAAALAALGCPAWPLAEVTERVDALLEDTDALRDWGLHPGQVEPLQAARPAVRSAFRELSTLGLPDLPAHGDAHPRNALHGPRGSVWFDWSEAACAAHPFMDAGWFLAFTLHLGRGKLPVREAHPDLEAQLSAAYLKALGCPDATRELSRSLPLALLHRAAVYDHRFRHWEGTIPRWRPNYVPYYLKQAARELTRLT